MSTRLMIQTDLPQLTFQQRWNHYLLIIAAIIGLVAGAIFRDNTIYAVSTYINASAGINVKYPKDWLIDTLGNYVFRVQDISRVGFKTTIQVSVQAISPNTSTRNIVDTLTLNRSQLLAAYRALPANNEFFLPDGTVATAVSYSYAAINPDPFLETDPIVVRGIDILSIKRGQAVIISFISDSNNYKDEYIIFERFLSTIEF